MKVAWTLAWTAEGVRPPNWPTIDQGAVFLVLPSRVAPQESVASNRDGTDAFCEGMTNVAVVDVALLVYRSVMLFGKKPAGKPSSALYYTATPPRWLVARLTRTLDRLQPLVPEKSSRCSHRQL
jgi:hypothetical protein